MPTPPSGLIPGAVDAVLALAAGGVGGGDRFGKAGVGAVTGAGHGAGHGAGQPDTDMGLASKTAVMRFSNSNSFGGGLGSGSTFGNLASPLSFLIGTVPGSPDWNYEAEVGDVWLNGAVGACLRWIGDNFFEPELRVELKQSDGTWAHDPKNLAASEAAALIVDPNPDYDGDALCSALSLSYYAAGLGYAIKARAKAGRKMYLYFAPWWEIAPVWPSDGSKLISGYTHRVDGANNPLSKDDVIVIRKGINPANPRGGLAPLASVLPDISADNAGGIYGAALLRNFGMPGIIIQPEDATGAGFDDVSRRQIGEEFQEKTTGENRGRPIVSSAKLKIDRVAMSPEDLALDKMRSIPEGRICAAIGLSPMVVNLPSGKDSKTYANYGEARRAAYHDCLIPLQKAFARSLTRQLLSDFGFAPGTARFAWDYGKVEAVSEDQDAKVKRELSKLTSGLSLRSQALVALGMPTATDGSDDVRYVPKTLVVIHDDNTPVEALTPVVGAGAASDGTSDGQPDATTASNDNGDRPAKPDAQPIDENA